MLEGIFDCIYLKPYICWVLFVCWAENGGEGYTHVATPRDLPSSKPSSPRGSKGHQQGHGHGDGDPLRESGQGQSPREQWDKLGQVRDVPAGSAAAHVRISRKELRRMSSEEVTLRKSVADQKESPLPTGGGGEWGQMAQWRFIETSYNI